MLLKNVQSHVLSRTSLVDYGKIGLEGGELDNSFWLLHCVIERRVITFSANMRPWPAVCLMLAHRLRRWANIKHTARQHLVFVGLADGSVENAFTLRTLYSFTRLSPFHMYIQSLNSGKNAATI